MSAPNAPPSYEYATNNKDQVNAPPEQPAYNPGYQAAGTGYPPQQPYAQEGYQTTPYPNYNAPGAPPAAENVQPLFMAPPVTNAPPAEAAGFTTGASFDDQNVRRLFIRKVFLVLSIQLLVTFGFICVFFFVDDVKSFVRATPALYYVSFAVFFIFYFILVCFSAAARKHPCNLIMLALLTLALSYMVGTISSFYDIEAVMIGVGVTVGVCTFVMIFSIQTKFDFTKCGGLLFVLVMVLFLFGFVTIFTYSRPWYLQVVYGSLGALVFTLFLAYDTQLVMGGRKYELDPEEYVFGALMLYIDVVYIFIFLLSIFGGSSN